MVGMGSGGSGDLSSGFDALRCLFWGFYSCLKFVLHVTSLKLKDFFVKHSNQHTCTCQSNNIEGSPFPTLPTCFSGEKGSQGTSLKGS